MTRLAPAVVRLLQRPEAERRLGSFFLVKPLGHGGFAPVWLAKEGLGSAELRTAAVKLFPLDGAGEEFGIAGTAGRKLIVEEARALCKVEHSNVVRFYTLCVDEGAGVLGLAMEHLAGTTLHEKIATARRLSADEAIRVGIAIASALSAVHRAKLVHRDVKPGNVVEAAGVYKLIDFGIASAEALNASEPPYREGRSGEAGAGNAAASVRGTATSQGGEATVRVVGLQSGTLGYIDPVCIATGAPASSASDLYALGATLFECLTGEVPAVAATSGSGQLHPAVLEGRTAPPPVRTLVPDVPLPVAELVDRMVAPLRLGRPPSAEWVAQRLEEIRLERHAEATLAELERTGPESAETAKCVLLALTTPEGIRATRQKEELTGLLGPAAEEVVDSFANAGLVAKGVQGVMFADETLIMHWGRLRKWIDEAREDRLLAQQLERDAKRWQVDPETEPLWQKRRLAAGEELRHRQGVRISAAAEEFLNASRRAEHRVRLGIATAAVVVALSPMVGGFAYWRATGAEEVARPPIPTHAKENPRRVVVEQRKNGGDVVSARNPTPVTAGHESRKDAFDRAAPDSSSRRSEVPSPPTALRSRLGSPTPPASASPAPEPPRLEPVPDW